MLGHEVDGVGRRELRGDDEVALVLAVLVVDQHEHAAGARLVQQLLGGGEEVVEADARRRRGRGGVGGPRAHAVSFRRAT